MESLRSVLLLVRFEGVSVNRIHAVDRPNSPYLKLGVSKRTFPMSNVYLIRDRLTNAIKIGISKHPKKRLKQLQTGAVGKLELIHVIKCVKKPALYLEKRILSWFRFNEKRGEWRFLSPEEIAFLCEFDTDRNFW